MSLETDRTTLLIDILQDLALAATDTTTEGREYILRKIQKLDHLCQPEPVTDDSDLREPMA